MQKRARSAGVEIIGLHWLLAKTEGFYVTSPDAIVRARTADYLVSLADAARHMGGELMVFGSPKQRSLLPGVSWDRAFEYAVDTFTRAMPGIADNGIRFCMEPLAPAEMASPLWSTSGTVPACGACSACRWQSAPGVSILACCSAPPFNSRPNQGMTMASFKTRGVYFR